MYPKVLIINEQSMHKKSATGITLESLWGDWPINNRMELYFQYDKECENNNIESKCINHIVPMRHVAELFYRKVKKKNGENDANIHSSRSSTKRGLFYSVFDMSYLKKSKKVFRMINDFNPDVIYTLGASITVLKFCNEVAKKFNIPIVIHFMDDWPHHLQSEKFYIQRVYKKKLTKVLNKTYNFCNVGIAISPFMAEEYKKETGKKYEFLMNSVDIDKYICDDLNNKSNLIFTYAGGLHLERWKPLLEIEECLKSNINKYEKKAELRIYCDKNMIEEEIINKFDKNITFFKEYVEHNEIKKVYEQASVLIQCENNNSKSLGFFKYSISTKIPEYLSTGRPVLYYAPKDMLLTNYLKSNNLALIATNKKELQDCIESCFLDYNKIVKNYKTRDISYVKDNHNIYIERKKLYNILNEAINMERKK